MKKTIVIVLALCMLLSCFGCAKKAEEKTTLIMATNAEFSPYEFREGEEIVGIDADIAKAIAEDMGLELVIEDMAFDSIIAAVQSGKADMALAGMSATEERKQNVNFSDIYTTSSLVTVVKKGSDITGTADLDGKTIGVQLGTTGDIYAADIPDVVMERYSKYFEAIQSLQQGKVDAVIIDMEPAKVFVSQNDDIVMLDEAFTVEEYAIAVAKENTELLEKINASLSKLKDSGKLDEIIGTYIKAD